MGKAGAKRRARGHPPSAHRRAALCAGLRALSLCCAEEEKRWRPAGGRTPIHAEILVWIDPVPSAAPAELDPRERAPGWEGARGPARAPPPPPPRRAGRMLQMVKTLAQFTIALEDMHDLGPDVANGEPVGSGGGTDITKEPGEAQV